MADEELLRIAWDIANEYHSPVDDCRACVARDRLYAYMDANGIDYGAGTSFDGWKG